MTQRIALVTGGSSGIGEATVRRLLQAGHIVYAAARRLDRMAALEEAGARLIRLDVTDDASMVAAIDRIRRENGRLDILVNNAGYGSYGALEDVSIAEARRQFDVNLFGVARLSQLALPMMRAHKYGKIVNVSSVGGKIWEPFGAWYHATKFALEGLSDCLRMEVTPFGIDVIVIEPGAIRTEWSGIAQESLVAASGETAYGPYARRHAKMLDQADKGRMALAPDVVAATIERVVQVNRPRTRYPVGGGARPFLLMMRLLSDRMFDRLMWRMSQSAT